MCRKRFDASACLGGDAFESIRSYLHRQRIEQERASLRRELENATNTAASILPTLEEARFDDTENEEAMVFAALLQSCLDAVETVRERLSLLPQVDSGSESSRSGSDEVEGGAANLQ